MSKVNVSYMLTGASFGLALALAGVCSPHILNTQMKLSDNTLFQTFLATSASSAIVLSALDFLNTAKISPRSSTSLPGLGPYGGNILGGALQGLALSLTSSSPETLLVQLVAPRPSTPYIFLGCIIGGIVYTGLTGLSSTRSSSTVSPKVSSIPKNFDLEARDVLPIYALSCMMLSLTVTVLTTGDPLDALSTAKAGMFIGLSQAISVLLTGNSLGVSGMYESLGLYFWRVVYQMTGIDLQKKRAPSVRILFLAAGVAVGGVVALRMGLVGRSSLVGSGKELSVARAILGGAAMALGARTAGGCTSGHGISGFSALSVSSFVTMGTMVVTGIVSTWLLL